MNTMDKVTIALSVYRPDETYLIKQLKSLDDQTYENIEILIFDDCVEHRCNPDIFKENIQKKKYRLLPYEEKNLGYTAAFQHLVEQSDGKYVAFCDQDDIWRSDKIEKSIQVIEKDHTVMAVSDRKLIDGQDKVICESVKKTSHNQHDVWGTRDDIVKYNFFQTYAPGMLMVMDGDFVRSTVPFSVHTGHDKWILACSQGNVSYIDETLVSYRRHGSNVSGLFSGVHSKKEYVQKRVIPHLQLVEEFIQRYPDVPGTDEALAFAKARKNHNVFQLFRYRYLAPNTAKFEIVLSIMPNPIFKLSIRVLQYLKSR